MTIDLNADLGESFVRVSSGDEEALLRLVTSANIACGYHAGDPTRMRRTVCRAAEYGVAVGAHPGYPDLAGFGRRELHASPEEIADMVLYQVGALAAFCSTERVPLRYVKPHGALYHRLAADVEAARAVARAVSYLDPSLVMLSAPGSALLEAARELGLRTATEGFADRGYRPDGSLLPRNQPGAVLTDPDRVAARALEIVRTGRLAAEGGEAITLRPDSLCIHSDTPGAVQLARAVRERLQAGGVHLKPFADAA